MLASQIVLGLQNIVSREVRPGTTAVVTVGSIHGGTKRNNIPDEVKLELTMRTYTEATREHLIQAVARISRAAALGANMPEDRLPLVRLIETEHAPALYNDPALVSRVRPARACWSSRPACRSTGGSAAARRAVSAKCERVRARARAP